MRVSNDGILELAGVGPLTHRAEAGPSKMKRFDITLAGESNLDLLLYGLPESLPAERELVADRMALLLGGSPAITAHNLAALGSKVGFITSRTRDVFSPLCARELVEAGVDLSRSVECPEGITTGVTVMLQHQSFRRNLTYPGATSTLRFDDLDLEYLSSARHFHLSSFFLQRALRPAVPRLFALLKDAGLTISMDTNDDPAGRFLGSMDEVFPYVDVLMPNEREACALAGEDRLEFAVRALAERVPLLIVKCGARGALGFRGQERFVADPIDVMTVDAVGAGDSFNAGFLHGYVRNWSIGRCLRMGNLAGAFSTTQIGGTSAFRDKVAMRKFLDKAVEDIGDRPDEVAEDRSPAPIRL